MTRLSVNINKVALVRNSREGNSPALVDAARVAIDAGCHGITVHPREDERHVRMSDLASLMAIPEIAAGEIEFNVEGDPRAALLDECARLSVHQFTAVPVTPGELTSHRGWRRGDDLGVLREVTGRLPRTTRLSLFLDPTPETVDIAAEFGFHAIEIYTGPYANAVGAEREAELARVVATAARARELSLRVHAGHDLTTENLPMLLGATQVDEVSIGHAIAAESMLTGLGIVVGRYLASSGDGKRA
ncbi:MAG: pyridoxine 5'-phosphate synthase [Phycisphaerales bacterium]|nr:pyridoxine 5'-phosphate synthase [Phycisphaerales bacterium]